MASLELVGNYIFLSGEWFTAQGEILRGLGVLETEADPDSIINCVIVDDSTGALRPFWTGRDIVTGITTYHLGEHRRSIARVTTDFDTWLKIVLAPSWDATVFMMNKVKFEGPLRMMWFLGREEPTGSIAATARLALLKCTVGFDAKAYAAARERVWVDLPAITSSIGNGSDNFPALFDILRRHIGERFYRGAQIYVSRAGITLADFAVGEAGPGLPMKPTTLSRWYCCAKPVSALAIMQLCRQFDIDIYSPVAVYLPEFGANNKEKIRIVDLLCHATPIVGEPIADCLYSSPAELYNIICDLSVASDYIPGQDANYGMFWAWTLLSFFTERLTGRPFEDFIRANVLQPLGMDRTFFGVSKQQYQALSEDAAWIYNCAGAEPSIEAEQARRLNYTSFNPAIGGVGPARDLAKVYELLLQATVRTIPPQSEFEVGEIMVRRHRTGIAERSTGIMTDTGLGIFYQSPDGLKEGERAYSYGPSCSPSTFGHKTYGASMAYVDPEQSLVFVFLTNGFSSTTVEKDKFHDTTLALYRDLEALA